MNHPDGGALDVGNSKQIREYKKKTEEFLEILHETMNLIQIQLKSNISKLNNIDDKITHNLYEYLI